MTAHQKKVPAHRWFWVPTKFFHNFPAIKLWAFLLVSGSCFLFGLPTRAGHFDSNELNENTAYGRCVGQFLNHPMRGQYALGQFSTEFYDDTDSLCRCMAVAQNKELLKGQNQSLSYFFSGRESFFSEIDSCVLNSVSSGNYTFFNASLTYDLIVPLIHHRLSKNQPSGTAVVLGRGPASIKKECMTMEVMKSCQKIKSLYFTYKCLKARLSTISYFEKIEKSCGQSESSYDRRI